MDGYVENVCWGGLIMKTLQGGQGGGSHAIPMDLANVSLTLRLFLNYVCSEI